MNKDTIVGIVGAVVLVAAMVGVFKYEGSQAQAGLGSKSFDLAWSTATANGPTAEATTPVGESAEETLSIMQANLTQAKLTLTWTATNGENTMRLKVTPPEGSGLEPMESDEESDGEIALTFSVPNELPPESTVFGNSEDEARARAASQHTKTVGTGDWLVEVTFVSASGLTPVPGAPPVLPDEEVSWTVKTQLTHYTPSLTEE